MDDEATLTGVESPWAIASERGSAPVPALVIVWSAEQPHRVGEISFLPANGQSRILGRGPDLEEDPFPRLVFARQRPGTGPDGTAIPGRQISRRQLTLRLHRGEIHVDRIGSCSTSVNGQRLSSGTLRAGDTIMLRDQLVLVCVERPVRMPPMISFPMDAANSFGLPDALGMVGESVTAWKLRDDISFVAGAAGHILVLEESGVGKEVAAHAIHAFSGRGARKLVARSAATIPDSLIDAELFGNVGNYPNPGMRDRPGLIGESDQSALLLDEIGELPPPLQSRLLRVLDNGGEYSRLREAKSRKADFRLIAATNRGAVELKHDFAARFTLRVEIPGMNVRREDIPLLIALLLKRAGQTTPDVARRYFEADDKKFARPRIAPNLIAYLVRHTYSLEMHELESLLWKAMLTSPGGFIGLTPDVRAEFEHSEVSEAVKPAEVTQEAVTESVQRHDGNITRAAKQLGLKTVTCSNA